MKQNTILIVDDAEVNRVILRSMFEESYNILEAENGEQALLLLEQYSGSIAIVLLDLVMPGKSGYEILEQMDRGEPLYHIPVIVITADESTDSKVRVFDLGASDIITKPFDPDIVKSRVKNIIELDRYRRHLEELVEEQSVRARESSSAVIDLLSSVIEHRSLESGQHIRRIRLFTQLLLKDVADSCLEYNLNKRKIRLITDASSMHDIGKIAIPDSILNKPGPLSPKEFEIMKTHTLRGCEILQGLDRLQDKEYLQYAYHICRYHHERWDGRGYPDGLKGDSIPICAQIVAIADCYDALTTDRVYKKAIPHNQAFNMILNGECGVFSPKLLESFKNVREAFAQLAREYADGLQPAEYTAAEGKSLTSVLPDITENTVEQSQLKYYAMLRYANATVMEVDLHTGVYHLVYLADTDFAALRSGGDFEESIRFFVETSVYPDDRPEVMKLLGGYMEELFTEGMTQRVRRYRILSRETGNYFWCRASLIRTDLENPRRRKALLLWSKEKEFESEQCRKEMQRSLVTEYLIDGFQKCRNDKYFTIVQINHVFSGLTGYTPEEVAEKFQNRFIELVYPADRDKLWRQFREQLSVGKTAELEYRITTKDGRIIWISDRCILTEENGEEYLSCIMLDVTKSREIQDELRLSLERHQIILNQTNDIIFEWDIKTDILQFSSNWEERYGYAPITKDVSIQIPRASHINPDDLPEFIGLTEAMSAGVPYKEIEFRLADAEGRYRWRRVRATAQFNEDGKPFKVVGVLIDIDSQKRASEKLEAKAEQDALTGLYNKTAAQIRIKKQLLERKPDSVSALMVLDVDNFKQINDRYGHMFGDAVLVELAAKIISFFRREDTIARIGGDEFLIFMPDIQTAEIAEQRVTQMIDTFSYMLREHLEGNSLSCSVGIAYITGRDDNSFQELFDHADRALYRAKAAGKNRYMCYREEMQSGNVGVSWETQEAVRTQIDSEQQIKWNLSHQVLQMFDILYRTKDFEQAVQTVLKMTGELFDVSRVYIFETMPDGVHVSNTYEWCSKETDSQKMDLQQISYVIDGVDYRDNFDKNGVFYCQDITKLPNCQRTFLEPQRILSLLQCAIRDGEVFKGFIGFDDCSVHRLWTQEQIQSLLFIGKLLSVFMMKKE